MRAIFTYHSIDDSGSPVSCRPEAFERHVRWLASSKIDVTTIDALLAMPPGADAVALTFDDAFTNFRDVALPLLQAHGFPCTLFVVADHAGGTNAWGRRPERTVPVLPLLDWAAIADLRRQGVVVGSHGRSHRDLTRVTVAELEDEIHGSAAIIGRETGINPGTFAYPYGAASPQVASVVSRVFACACTTEFRSVREGADAMLLPRLDAYYFQAPGLLESWGTPGFARFLARRRGLRRLRALGQEAVGRVLSLHEAQ